MGFWKSATYALVGAGLMFASSQVFADVVIDDFEGGTNANKIGTYWYFYDDKKDENGGQSEITNATVDATSGDYVFAGAYGPGNASDYCGSMAFTLGDSVGMKEYVRPFVGMGVNLSNAVDANDLAMPIDLSPATAISFDIKADAAMTVKFVIELSGIIDFDHYNTTIPLTTAWQTVTVNFTAGLGGVSQEGWGDIVPFDETTITKFSWQIRANENEEKMAGQIDIDNVTIVSAGPISGLKMHGSVADLVKPGVGTPPAVGLFSNFENAKVAERTKNRVNQYWYVYTDAEARTDPAAASIFTSGLNAVGTLAIPEGLGASATNGINVTFELGSAFSDGTNTIRPFCGIGTNLGIDTVATSFFDATASSGTGLYFDYNSDVEIAVEIADDLLRADNAGLVFYALLPATTGWSNVTIPWASFVLPEWDEVTALPAADKTLHVNKLKKIQWKMQNDALTTGVVSIDNVYIVGSTYLGIGVVHGKNSFARQGVSFYQENNRVNLDLSKSSSAVSNVALLNSLGKVVASKNVAANTKSFSLPLQNQASGVYVLKVTSVDGSSVVRPMSVVR